MKIFYFFLIWAFILSVIGFIYILIRTISHNHRYIRKLWKKDCYETEKFSILFELYKVVSNEQIIQTSDNSQIEFMTEKLGEIITLDEKILVLLNELGEKK